MTHVTHIWRELGDKWKWINWEGRRRQNRIFAFWPILGTDSYRKFFFNAQSISQGTEEGTFERWLSTLFQISPLGICEHHSYGMHGVLLHKKIEAYCLNKMKYCQL